MPQPLPFPSDSNSTTEEVLQTLLCGICRVTRKPRIELDGDTYQIHVEAEDQGRVIGKEGRMIGAINAIIYFVSSRCDGIVQNVRINSNGDAVARNRPFQPKPEWKRDRVDSVLDAIQHCFSVLIKWQINAVGSRGVITIFIPAPRGDFVSELLDLEDAIIKVVKAAANAEGALMEIRVEWAP